MATIAEKQPSRPRGAIRTFPDRPITIPTARAEAAKNLLTSVYELWEQGQHYRSLQAWFATPLDQRDDAINSILLQKAEPANHSLATVQFETEGRPENLVFSHYALLTIPAVGRIIIPSSDPITTEDARQLSSNPFDIEGINTFTERLKRVGLGEGYYWNDESDFIEPRVDIRNNFQLEEERNFLLNLIPRLASEEARYRLFSTTGPVHGVHHADLLADPRLADYLEDTLLIRDGWVAVLENFLSQGEFPSPEFFKEAFRRLNPEESDPQAILKGQDGIEVPASMYFFNILRRITLLKDARERYPDFGEGREERIIAYLLNDAFMERALPYFFTDNLYRDNFISEGYGLRFVSADVEATGDEARRLKQKRFGEMLGAAEMYLQEKGDTATIQKLKEREVAGVKFIDYWPTEATPHP